MSVSIIADSQIFQAKEIFSQLGCVTLSDSYQIKRDMLIHADALLVRSVNLVNQDLLADTSVRFVGSATGGTNHIDHAYLKRRGIYFSATPGSYARAVAEYVLSSLSVLALQRNMSLDGKVLGIIGCGHIGNMLKKFAENLGMRCLVNDPPRAEQDMSQDWHQLADIAQADMISIHVPLTDHGAYPTRKLVNQKFLSQLKSDVILVNTSRGEVIDETALCKFKFKYPDVGIVLDVWCDEPEINLDLLECANIATPHIAGYTLNSKKLAAKILFFKLASFLGRQPQDWDDHDDKNQATIALQKRICIPSVILHAYDVQQDDALLRQIRSICLEERSDFFSTLRKNYSLRREFHDYTITGQDASSHNIMQLQNLGFCLSS